MRNIILSIFLVLFNFSSLSAKSYENMTEDELLKNFFILNKQEKKEKVKTKALKIELKEEQAKTKVLEEELEVEQVETKALKKIRKALEKAKK
jgi:hypothetical protein